jgi:hypothetical protein
VNKHAILPLFLFVVAIFTTACCPVTRVPEPVVVKPKSCLSGLGERPLPPEGSRACDDEWADYYERLVEYDEAVDVACGGDQ